MTNSRLTDAHAQNVAGHLPTCLLCGGVAGRNVFPYGTIWEGRCFSYVRCHNCRSSVMDPIPSGEDLERMYSYAAYHAEFYQDASDSVSQTLLNSAIPFLKRSGRLLDFGCGSGAFLIAAANFGFCCEGVELEEQTRRAAATATGCPIISVATLWKNRPTYDVIHLGDVLEHLPNPERMMRELSQFLAPDGVFFVEGPLEENPSPVIYAARLFGWMKRLLGRNVYAALPPFHLFRTTATAQRSFFERRLGYQILLFRVYESGWPYLNTGDRLLHPKSFVKLVQMLIGKFAVMAARAAAPLPVGNRFAAVVKPRV